jgi:hypothetical protein
LLASHIFPSIIHNGGKNLEHVETVEILIYVMLENHIGN